MILLLVGAAGFAGAVARYVVDLWAVARFGSNVPLGTLAVNLLGALLLGIFFGATAARAGIPEEVRAPIAVGFIATFTTFSTYLLDAWIRFERGELTFATAYLVGSVVAGLLVLRVGLFIGRGA